MSIKKIILLSCCLSFLYSNLCFSETWQEAEANMQYVFVLSSPGHYQSLYTVTSSSKADNYVAFTLSPLGIKRLMGDNTNCSYYELSGISSKLMQTIEKNQVILFKKQALAEPVGPYPPAPLPFRTPNAPANYAEPVSPYPPFPLPFRTSNALVNYAEPVGPYPPFPLPFRTPTLANYFDAAECIS